MATGDVGGGRAGGGRTLDRRPAPASAPRSAATAARWRATRAAPTAAPKSPDQDEHQSHREQADGRPTPITVRMPRPAGSPAHGSPSPSAGFPAFDSPVTGSTAADGGRLHGGRLHGGRLHPTPGTGLPCHRHRANRLRGGGFEGRDGGGRHGEPR